MQCLYRGSLNPKGHCMDLTIQGSGANISVTAWEHRKSREGLETEVIYVIFPIKCIRSGSGTILYLFITDAKARETYCIQYI